MVKLSWLGADGQYRIELLGLKDGRKAPKSAAVDPSIFALSENEAEPVNGG